MIKMFRLENVSKEFISKENKILALSDINIEIKKGVVYGIIGFSGAGKSTLIRCMNLLEVPNHGKIFFDNVDLLEMNKKDLQKYRQKIGMIFQQFNLLSQATVKKNISYPLEIAGVKKKEIDRRTKELLKLVGLSDKEYAYPSELSGGQKQRVAIARALATNPQVLLCDDATSALDPVTTISILKLLREINEQLGVTIVIITHEMKVVEQICDRVAVMSQGKIKEEGIPTDIFLNPKSLITRKLVNSNRTNYKKGDEAV